MDATPFLPGRARTIRGLARVVDDCRGCPISALRNRAVFGEGARDARLVLVGEQPGDREDREGRPFVGPAGRELDRVLEAAGIARGKAYVTNVVKRFKFKEVGRRRLHDKPNRGEVKACRPWLDRELELIRPEALVALGATAAQSLFGNEFRVSTMHGEWIESPLAPLSMATIHPSAILRSRDQETSEERRAQMIADLSILADRLGSANPAPPGR